ncbi:DEAD/DEAH box helicase family protein, partial [Planctomycetota bacterium]
MELAGNILRITAPNKSPLLTGIHRIHLSTVLNFDVAKEFSGYLIDLSPDSLVLVHDVISYLREANFEYSIDSATKKIFDQFTNGLSELQKSLAIGRDLKNKKVRKLRLPTLKRILKPYQVPAVAHLSRVAHAANFSVPGSGKTTITLAAFDILKHADYVSKLLVIGPRASFMPWEEEFAECFGRKPVSVRISGNKKSRLKQYRNSEKYELILMTYPIASNDTSALISLLRKENVFLVI